MALLSLTTSGVSAMHGFGHADLFVMSAFVSLVSSMSFWWRDVIAEGTSRFLNSIKLNKLNISKVINNEEIETILTQSTLNKDRVLSLSNLSDDQFGFYLAGLLEGDGHISLPYKGKTILNRILNPRIVFTGHKNDLPLYVFVQARLGGIGRFQIVNDNVIRYIIGDKKGIIHFINIVHGKLKTPKNITFNQLIEFFNMKYSLSLLTSNLNKSNLLENNWLAGFTEADGSFGVKIVESKSKSEDRKRSVSASISLKFRLDQRLMDKMTSSSMLYIMEEIANSLSTDLKTYNESKADKTTVLSIGVTAIDKLERVVKYFDKYPLFGVKSKNYSDWRTVYDLIVSKEHLTEQGRVKIKLIHSNMNNKRVFNNLD